MRELYHYKRVVGCPYGCCGDLRPKTKVRALFLSRKGAKSRAKATKREHRLTRRLRDKVIETELAEMVNDYALDDIEFKQAMRDIGLDEHFNPLPDMLDWSELDLNYFE